MPTMPTTRCTLRRGANVFALAVVLLASLVVPGVRADTAGDFNTAQAKLTQLQDESDRLVDQFNGEAAKLDGLNAQIQDAQVRLDQLSGYVKDDRDTIRDQAIATYKYGGASIAQLGVLMESQSLDTYGRAMKYMKSIQARSLNAFNTFSSSRTALDATRAKLKAAQAQKAAMVATLTQQKAAIDVSIQQQQAIVDQYRTQLQQQAATDAAAAQQLISTGQLPPASTAQAQGAIDYAKAQLGKPYCYGGTGPACYDCSGLVMMAYQSVGIFLPRTSGDMDASLQQDPTPQPGDIAWHPGHVGLYVGAGFTIEAPHTGDVIRYRPVGNRFSVFLRPVSVPGAPAGGGDVGATPPGAPSPSSTTTTTSSTTTTTTPASTTTTSPP